MSGIELGERLATAGGHASVSSSGPALLAFIGKAQMNRILSSLLIALALVVSGCATLPPPTDRVETNALTDTAETRLGRAVAPRVAENSDKTGIHAMPNPRDAFAARIL